jgi:hypothetical protein
VLAGFLYGMKGNAGVKATGLLEGSPALQNPMIVQQFHR